MAVQTYGVTLAMVEAEFRSSDLSSISTDITRWSKIYGGAADVLVRKQGYDPAAIVALGDDDSLYNMCQLYVVNGVAAKVARSGAMQDVSLAEALDTERALLEQQIQASPQSVSDTSTREDNRGGALTNRDGTTLPLRVASTWWADTGKF